MNGGARTRCAWAAAGMAGAPATGRDSQGYAMQRASEPCKAGHFVENAPGAPAVSPKEQRHQAARDLASLTHVLRRRDDIYPPERMERQQILVATHDQVRIATDGQFQELVIF